MAFVLITSGVFLAAAGGWRSYVMAREAIGPLPVIERPRVRLFARRVFLAVGWLVVAMYGLYLLSVGDAILVR